MVTGFAFLSRLTQIAPPSTRFVFLGAGIRLGLPSHPASRRRSCLRLGVSTTSSSRGLSPPIDRPCRAYSSAAPAAPRAGTSVGLSLGEARPTRAGPTPEAIADQPGSSGYAPGAARCRLPRRSIVRLPAAASRSLPAVASHAIGFAEPRPGVHSPGFGGCEEAVRRKFRGELRGRNRGARSTGGSLAHVGEDVAEDLVGEGDRLGAG